MKTQNNSNVTYVIKNVISTVHLRPISAAHKKRKPFECSFFNPKWFKCYFCDFEWTFNNRMKRHINAIHGKQKAFECGFCEKLFSQKGSLNAHVKIVYETPKNMWMSVVWKRIWNILYIKYSWKSCQFAKKKNIKYKEKINLCNVNLLDILIKKLNI